MTSIFEKIISREISAEILDEDENCIAIKDIQPQAPFHALVIPKKKIPRIAESDYSDVKLLGHLLNKTKEIAKDNNLENGYRIVINNGKDGGESVPHLHIHLLGGRSLAWPPG